MPLTPLFVFPHHHHATLPVFQVAGSPIQRLHRKSARPRETPGGKEMFLFCHSGLDVDLGPEVAEQGDGPKVGARK